MRLTVGPLPPAVYWRRRAIVLGAVLLVVLAFYAACGGSANGGDTAKETPSPTPGDLLPPEPEPTGTLLTPETGGPAGPAGGEPTATGEAGANGGGQPQGPGGDAPCTDDELTVAAVPAKTTIGVGKPVDIRLRITNSSDRSCSRDVGADEQELRVVQGAQTVWSSDHCGAQRGSDVRVIGAGRTLDFGVAWNGRYSDKCSAGAPDGDSPQAGEYQVIARLGTKHSAPVPITLRDG